jgi:hypothetical protein
MPVYLPIKAVAAFVVSFLILALVPAAVSAQGNGSIYQVQGGSVPIFFNFSVSGQTFVATILTFGPSGNNGRWFAVIGSTNGTSGTGELVFPSGLALTIPPGSSFHFDLDQPGAAGGSFTSSGLSGFLAVTSGRMVRLFP